MLDKITHVCFTQRLFTTKHPWVKGVQVCSNEESFSSHKINNAGASANVDFGEAKNIFRGRGVLKHVFDSILKISARLFTIFFILY